MTKEKKISLLKITLTSLIVLVTIYFSVWKVNFTELIQSFRYANYWIVFLVLPMTALGNFIRAARWKVILQTIHPTAKMGNLFAGVNIGYFMNTIIPRSGEIARPYVTAQSERETSFSSLLGTIVVERVIDVMALLLVAVIMLVFDTKLFDGFQDLGISEGAVKRLLYPALVLGVGVLLIAPSKAGLWIAETLSKPLPEKIRAGIIDIFKKLQAGFGSIKTLRQVVFTIVYTVLLYTVYMLPCWFMFFAFESGRVAHPVLFNGLQMFTLTALAVAIAPTPGAFGVFHVTARIAAMKLLNFSFADALAYGTLLHFGTYLMLITLGLYYLITKNLSLKELIKAKK
jgi:glycosyltransferase 2 family protein